MRLLNLLLLQELQVGLEEIELGAMMKKTFQIMTRRELKGVADVQDLGIM